MSPDGLVQFPKSCARLASILVFFTGALVLVGWTFDIAAIKSLSPGWPKMAATTALAFTLGGIGLWCSAGGLAGPGQRKGQESWRRRLSLGCGVAVAAIGLSNIVELLGGWSFGLDDFWFNERPSLSGPARMAPTTAFDFVLLGCAFVLAQRTRFIGAFQFLTLLGVLLGWLGLSQYLYGGGSMVPFGEMAVHTALALVALNAGLFTLRTDGGLMALLISESAGGVVARRLVPAALVFPVLFGWLRLEGQRAGWFGTEAGVSLFALANILVFGGLIWANTALLHGSDLHRKQAEQRSLDLNAQLEQRVQERTVELTAANKELAALTYTLAHDLRAPLRHIDAFAQMLAEDFGAALPAGAQEHLAGIRRGSATMSQLVEDWLRLARIGRQELNRQPTELGRVVEEVLADAKRQTQERSVQWNVQPLPTVDCDAGLIRQVFAVLLSNSAKFTRSRPLAVIEVGCLDHGDHKVVFVRDNGVGFNMEYGDKLFGAFQRLHPVAEFEGTGVGLATAERIVRKHGGRIWAEATVDKGATFYFTLGELQKRPAHLIARQDDKLPAARPGRTGS